jgi:hypothetical protein
MVNPKSIYLIVIISICVGGLHFFIGPTYSGPYRDFVSGYLMDLLLPMNLYLLLQISLRKVISKPKSRIGAASFTFLFGLTVEILQRNQVEVFGSTYDPRDILMYGCGVALGLMIDIIGLDRLEAQKSGEI